MGTLIKVNWKFYTYTYYLLIWDASVDEEMEVSIKKVADFMQRPFDCGKQH